MVKKIIAAICILPILIIVFSLPVAISTGFGEMGQGPLALASLLGYFGSMTLIMVGIYFLGRWVYRTLRPTPSTAPEDVGSDGK